MSGLRSTSMASVGAGIAIKFELQRTKEVELRRLRGDFTFDELLTSVNHMWGSAPKHLLIEYVDDEGDRVKIGSEAEWGEAVTQFLSSGSPALRLFVRRTRKNGGSRKAEEVDSGSDAEVTEQPAPERRTPSSRVAVPPLKLPEAPASEAPAAAARAPSPVAPVSPAAEAMMPRVETGDDSQAAVVDLLSRLYDCDAGREMMNMFSPVDFAPIVRRRLDAVAGEVLVDVDNVALRHLTISRTNMWIGQRLYEKAEATLEAALLVWPADQVLEYNAACAAALRGDVVKALAQLEAAATHGYNDVSQLENDPDLASLRQTARFKSIVAGVRARTGVPASAPAAAVEVAAPVDAPAAATPAATAAAPTAPPAEKFDPVATLMAMFPQLSADAATRLLKRHGGDLARAATSALGN